MSELTTKQAHEKIAELLKQAEALIEEATVVASEAGIGFHWDGPDYGMGGYWRESGWTASSQSC